MPIALEARWKNFNKLLIVPYIVGREHNNLGQSVYLESVALNLHSFYTGIERLFELIARHVDGDPASGQMWHRDLIQQMANDELKVRPAVISADTASQLDEFRRFRHLVRNAYSFNLEADKMTGVVDTLSPLWKQIRAELLAFADFLEALSNASD